ncbi:paraquat-inducible protein A [Pseudooceanicola antarcticus]|uniref:Paraquat-inducible protein A n=1 Tax=Pseudooceanicola antarcticus TaxID=1247613 RepID=A0A285HMK1_9RHOB|nr:paraquat-inducible protein A [Pseudooceanicola antarcticus]PJE27796.1 paraquat-inducible protein A [Pseudooceanicola antarcticus]SNY36978.1 paraquat-inducible protein A [Pseudooceanicola antarcticus]
MPDSPAAPVPRDPLADLIACPRCDAVQREVEPAPGQRAVCLRCDHVLIAPRKSAGKQIIAVCLAVLILAVTATSLPFLRISRAGLAHASSILDAALAFSSSPLFAALSLLLAALIVFIPALRAVLSIYVLLPLVRDRAPFPGAIQAFRLSEALRPWSMAEVFAIGCAVALIKVTDLARVEFGAAFWIFALLVILVPVQDGLTCRHSVWKSLDREVRR